MNTLAVLVEAEDDKTHDHESRRPVESKSLPLTVTSSAKNSNSVKIDIPKESIQTLNSNDENAA